jgi:hypothetical protein
MSFAIKPITQQPHNFKFDVFWEFVCWWYWAKQYISVVHARMFALHSSKPSVVVSTGGGLPTHYTPTCLVGLWASLGNLMLLEDR